MKGFTLIELLAVIVILTIILLITIPVITGVIENIKESSLKMTANNIAKSAEYTYANEVFNLTNVRELIFTFDGENIVGNYPNVSLNFNGKIPESGNLIIRKDGKIALSIFTEGKCIRKDYEEKEASIVELTSDNCVSEISIPNVTLNGSNIVNVEIHEEYTEAGVVATGIYGDTITDVTTEIRKDGNVVASIDTSVLGNYIITYQVFEEGKTNYTSREVRIVDTIKPVITIPGVTNLVINEVNSFDLMAGVSVSDNSLETLSITVSGSIARIAGSYQITYSAIDSSGNEESIIRVINISDVEAPVITLNGAAIINLNVGDTYSELGATALDDADGNLTSSIVISGTVNTNTPGTYYKTYTVSDTSNNETNVTRTINVIDNIAPTVTFGTNGNAAYAKNHSTTVTVSDNVAVANRYYQWTTSTTAPATGSFSMTFTNGSTIASPAGVSGTYYLWIKAVDAALNETIIRSNAFNLDNIAPQISLDINGYEDAVKSIDVEVSMTDNISLSSGHYAIDVVYTGLAPSSINNAISNGDMITVTCPDGTSNGYYVWIKAVDTAGNQTIYVSEYFNIDNEAPEVFFNPDTNTTYAKTRTVGVGLDDLQGGSGAATSYYQWTTSTTVPTSASFTQSFTPVDPYANITTPAGVSGTYYLWIKSIDNLGNMKIKRSNAFNLDNSLPTVAFGTNGNSTYAKNHSTTVTVSDNVAVANRYYQWTTSTTAPTTGSFSTTFTNGATITTPAGVSGTYYLWIKAIDDSSNEAIIRSNAFNLDNTAPVITSVSLSSSSATTSGFTITRTGNATDAHSGLLANPYIYQTSTDNVNFTARCTSNSTTCTVTGLLDNTTYYYRVCVFDNTTNQSCTSSLTATTLKEEYSSSEGVNQPVLVAGMTPVKWNGSAWANTTESDSDWYNYTSVDKKWANAKTNDGSLWVWVPRFAYQISTNYHLRNEGTINVKFLKAKTNTASDDSTVATTPTYSGSSQTNYIKHPAFTFGGSEILGFWIAKFEPSGTYANLAIAPNVNPLVSGNFSTQFNAAYNMRSNTARYGWNASVIDTHMAKNSEWGALAYLSRSIYGANTNRVWNNAYANAGVYITGCSGLTQDAINETTCVQYNTTNGVKATTTGNIYGVYDMAGGASEVVAAHLQNGHANVFDNTYQIVDANGKYREYYSYDSFSDTSFNNYQLSVSIFGDAVYETSSGFDYNNAWFLQSSSFPRTALPFFIRGGGVGVTPGIFGFYYYSGSGSSNNTFRPIAIPIP